MTPDYTPPDDASGEMHPPPEYYPQSPDGGARLIVGKGFQKGNKAAAGPRNLGANVRMHLNSLRNKNETQVRNIAKNKNSKICRRIAAQTLLDAIERPDLADYQELLDGTYSLKDLRAAGVSTDCIKKLKARVRNVGQGENKETVTEREVEFYDRAGTARDRAIAHTDGTPITRTESNVQVQRTTLDIARLPVADVKVLLEMIRRNKQAQVQVTPPAPQPPLPAPEGNGGGS